MGLNVITQENFTGDKRAGSEPHFYEQDLIKETSGLRTLLESSVIASFSCHQNDICLSHIWKGSSGHSVILYSKPLLMGRLSLLVLVTAFSSLY